MIRKEPASVSVPAGRRPRDFTTPLQTTIKWFALSEKRVVKTDKALIRIAAFALGLAPCFPCFAENASNISPINPINPCFRIHEKKVFERCLADHNITPMLFMPERNARLKPISRSNETVVYILYPPPFISTEYGLGYMVNCSTKYTYVMDPLKGYGLIGHFAKGSVSDYACSTFIEPRSNGK